MNDETIELVKRHREAAHEQGLIVGVVCTAGVFLFVAVVFKIVGVTCS
jgi:hypothetical protein